MAGDSRNPDLETPIDRGANASYSGFQVSNIETAYSRAKANGAITVTPGGIINYEKGRAVMIRDSDVGGYIMLWQPAK